jgi:hypothetical protein
MTDNTRSLLILLSLLCLVAAPLAVVAVGYQRLERFGNKFHLGPGAVVVTLTLLLVTISMLGAIVAWLIARARKDRDDIDAYTAAAWLAIALNIGEAIWVAVYYGRWWPLNL